MPRSGSGMAGVAMVVVGLLIFIPSGLCTGFGVFGAVAGAGFQILPLVLGIGAPFVIGGALLVRAGLRRLRDPSAPPD